MNTSSQRTAPSNNQSIKERCVHNMLAALAQAQQKPKPQHLLFPSTHLLNHRPTTKSHLLSQQQIDTLNHTLEMIKALNLLATSINAQIVPLPCPLPKLVLGDAGLLASAIDDALFQTSLTLTRLGLKESPF